MNIGIHQENPLGQSHSITFNEKNVRFRSNAFVQKRSTYFPYVAYGIHA